VEILLIARRGERLWEALVKPGRRVREGTVLEFEGASSRPDLPSTGLAEAHEDPCAPPATCTFWARSLAVPGRRAPDTILWARDVEGTLERIGATPSRPTSTSHWRTPSAIKPSILG